MIYSLQQDNFVAALARAISDRPMWGGYAQDAEALILQAIAALDPNPWEQLQKVEAAYMELLERHLEKSLESKDIIPHLGDIAVFTLPDSATPYRGLVVDTEMAERPGTAGGILRDYQGLVTIWMPDESELVAINRLWIQELVDDLPTRADLAERWATLLGLGRDRPHISVWSGDEKLEAWPDSYGYGLRVTEFHQGEDYVSEDYRFDQASLPSELRIVLALAPGTGPIPYALERLLWLIPGGKEYDQWAV